MTLTIKYFGMLAELTECEQESINTEINNITIADVLIFLYTKHPDLKNKDFQIAQSNIICNKNEKVTATELALLPPFSGG